MQNTKLLQLFKAIKAEEFREFTQFLKSPFYNRSQRVILLFEYLKKYKNNLDDDKLRKEYAFKRLFPKGEEYADWKMRELMSDLSKLIEEYFVVKEAEQNPMDRQMLLIRSFEKRQVDDHFFKYAYRLDKEIDNLELKTMEHYIAQLQLQSRLYYHDSTSKLKNKGGKELLSGIMYNTDMMYSLAKLRYGYEIKAWEQVRGEQLKGFIPDKFLEKLPQKVLNDNTLLRIYQISTHFYKLHNALKTPTVKEQSLQDESAAQKLLGMYYEMKELVINNISKLSGRDEALDLITLLINSATLTVADNREYFSLYKIGVDNEVFTMYGSFPQSHFTNIVIISCGIGEFEWTQNFINKYYIYLPDEDDKKENIIRLYKAYLSFYKKEYEQVEFLLYTLEFEDVSYGLRHYTLLIASLYELERELHDSCDNFKQYMYRKHKTKLIGTDIRKPHNNFIKIVLGMANIRGQFKPDIATLKKDLDKMPNVVMKTWLIEKIAELNKNVHYKQKDVANY